MLSDVHGIYDTQIDKINEVNVCFLTASVEGYKEEFGQSLVSLTSNHFTYPNIHFIVKPITMDDLVKKVNEMVDE
jgi:hypothetical protein